jgi:hypothetical protein
MNSIGVIDFSRQPSWSAVSGQLSAFSQQVGIGLLADGGWLTADGSKKEMMRALS